MAGRLHVVRAASRLAPGLFPWSIWQVLLRSPVVVPADSRQVAELAVAGVDVTVISADDPHPVDVLTAVAQGGDVAWIVESSPWRSAETDLVVDAWHAFGGDVLDHGEPDVPSGSHLLDLVSVMDVLRSPGGCPWDAQQTHESLLRYLIEESYEVVDAVHSGHDDELREELGDLALQVAFHARIAEERGEGPWSIDDVADGIVAKLVRRHPHVFARTQEHEGVDADDVDVRWKQLKAREKSRTGVLDGVPRSQPALLLAAALQSRADAEALASADFSTEASVDLGTAVDAVVIGEHLFAVARLAAAHGVDAESALRSTVLNAAARIDAARTDGRPI